VAYGPRRTVLDQLVVDAAAEAGAEVREGFTVNEVVVEDGRVTDVRGPGRPGRTVTERARVVVGADGRHSAVARAVGPEQYHERPPLLCATTPTGAGCPWTAASRPGSAPAAAGPPGPPTTT
jgi:flavin-dependent dehydrogenase